MKHTGFTLIELLIVVAIIGILAAIAIPNYLNAQTRSKVSKVQSELKSFKTAIEMYRLDNNSYLYDGNDFPEPKMEKFNQKNIQYVLTTPIAYISGIFDDPFNSKEINPEDPMLNILFNTPPHPYIYFSLNGYSVHQGNISEYTLFSFSPDQDFDNANTSKDTSIIYDASNGITSNGDIIVFGP